MKEGEKPLIIAHRGFALKYPENTLAAFQASVGIADMIELDVRLSFNGDVVVIHDEITEETRFPILLFSDVLEFLKTNDLLVNVELKEDSLELVSQVIELIKVSGLKQERCLFSSFHLKALKLIKEHDASAIVSLIFEPKDKLTIPFEVVDGIVLEKEIIKSLSHDDFVALRNSGILISVFTVNDLKGMKYFLDERIVDGIITDRPDVLRSIFE